jgi:hypothetical protein
MRKLKRMPAANAMLAPDRLPDIAAGETVQDVVRPQIDERVAAVMREIEALRADYMRVQGIYFGVVSRSWDGMTGAAPTEDEKRAVTACLDDIERAEPRLRHFRKAVEARNR